MLAGAAVVVFGAGQLVEKIKNGKYVSKEICAQIHKREDERWKRIDENIQKIWNKLDKF